MPLYAMAYGHRRFSVKGGKGCAEVSKYTIIFYFYDVTIIVTLFLAVAYFFSSSAVEQRAISFGH